MRTGDERKGGRGRNICTSIQETFVQAFKKHLYQHSKHVLYAVRVREKRYSLSHSPKIGRITILSLNLHSMLGTLSRNTRCLTPSHRQRVVEVCSPKREEGRERRGTEPCVCRAADARPRRSTLARPPPYGSGARPPPLPVYVRLRSAAQRGSVVGQARLRAGRMARRSQAARE